VLRIISPTITNIKLYQVLIDGGAALNLISLTAFKKLQILMSKLQPSRPFCGVDPVSVMPRGCISLPVTFRTPENFHTKNVLFNVEEVNLPFNAILGRPIPIYGGCLLRVHAFEDAISQWRPQDTWRPRCRCLYTRESPSPGSLS
jgi:hypothetical protein